MTILIRFGMRLRLLLVSALLLLAASLTFAQDPGTAIEKENGLDTDYAANMRVELVGQRVAWAAGLTDIQFIIFNNNELNAFALPDGRVYVTSLMAHAVTDDELAFVLGHELTHIKERHAEHQNNRATGGAILGAVLAAVLGGGPGDIRLGADIAGGLTLGHYSRKDERAADQGGLKWMTRAGYDPRQAANAMQRLIDKYGKGDANVPILGWFATHPDTKDRRDYLRNGAEAILKNPPEQIPPAKGVEFTLDPRAQHAFAWAHNYFSLAVAAESDGHAVVVPVLLLIPTQPVNTTTSSELPILVPALGNQATDQKNKDKKKDEPLPAVVVKPPIAPLGYRVTLDLEQVPAGRAATIEKKDGTAVQATLTWTELTTGFTGVFTTTAQTRKDEPWMAQQQVNEKELFLLSDGKNDNLEGTLEAAAVRRVVRAFGEMVKTGGPVDHGMPVKLKITDGDNARPGDYIAIVRNGRMAAEVAADEVKGKNVTGTVLWGTHVWKKGDHFVLMKE